MGSRPDASVPDSAPKVHAIHRLYDLFLRHFRTRRLLDLYRQLRIVPATRLLDLGGNAFIWELAASMGLPLPEITIVNLYPNRGPLPPGIRWVVADAGLLPFRDGEFDVVFSNSVIEHLGTAAAQSQFAREAVRAGWRLFVQTPSRWFPIEPHLMAPFIHWLPRKLRRMLLRNFTVWGLLTRPSPEQCQKFLEEVRLLDRRDAQRMFPGFDVGSEKLLGITKSIVVTGGLG
jgi:SAM-dependent methyltransferase